MEAIDTPVMWAHFILWICTTELILFIAVIAFNLAKKRGESARDPQRRNLQIWGFFFLLLLISNILILTWRFAISDFLVADILERVANALFYFAIFIRVVDIEKRVLNRKIYYFSIILGIIVLINLFVAPSILKIISPWQVAFLVSVIIGYSVFPIVFFSLSRRSTGKIRTDAFKVSAGAIFLALGYLFRPENLEAYRIYPFLNTIIDLFYISAPIVIIIGILLIYDSFRKKE